MDYKKKVSGCFKWQVCVKPDDHAIQLHLRINQRASCASLEARTSDYLHKDAHMINFNRNESNFI